VADAAFAPHRLEGTPYRLDSVLGEGAMGEVYLGHHVDLRRPAVIKLIKAKYTSEPQVVDRMRREARIVARLRHDALVTIYDLGTAADGRTYIAMEYLDGTVLRRIMQTRGVVPLDDAARWMAQACDGLDVAHREGVIHRDIKPENLFVTSEGQLKVLDFGVAKPLGDENATGARTAAGMVLGTPRYMAPEQATGKSLSPATDVYAIGCVLFEMLTGSPLFDGRDARELLWHHLNTAPSTLQARTRQAFDPQLEAIVAKALQKDPQQRYQRAAELAKELRALKSANERPTIKVDQQPTVKVEQIVPPQAHHTTHVSPPPGDVSPYDDTRAIPAMNLVQGVSTTERAPVMKTAQTERLPEPAASGGTGALAAEVSTSPVVRPMPLWPFAIGILFFAGAITAIVMVMRAGNEETTKEKPVAVAKPAPTPTPEPVATPEPKPEPTPEPTPSAKVEPVPTAKATVAIKPTAAPTTSASSAINAYDKSKQLMADGDLDAAEREARSAIATHGNAARLLLGEILERKGKPQLARDIYKKVLEVDPNNGVAKTRLAKLGG
jgi:serine/threonine protein kinase